MDQKHITIEQYITDEFHDLISRKVRSFVYKNCTDYKTKYITDVRYKELQNIWVTSLYTEGCLSEYLTIKCNVRAEYKVCGYILKYPEMGYLTEMTQLWLAVDIRAKLDKKFTCVNVSDIRFIEDKSAFNMIGSTSKRFIPYMQEKSLDFYATEFLKKYYPEALVEPTHLDMEKLMHRMGVVAERRDARGDIFGQMFFADTLTDDGSRTIKKGTLVYYSNSYFCEEVGSERNTIVHECVHWEYHKRYFTIQQLLNSEQTAINCTKLNIDINNPALNTEDFRWMEYQANALAPRILIPEEMGRKKYTEIIQKYKAIKSITKGDALKRTISEFANFFGVSITSAKIRLIELGYYQVRGAYDFVSMIPNRTYCSSKRLNKNETFTASLDDAIAAQLANPKLRAAVNEGRVLFVKGFYIINNPKYLYKNSVTGELDLTDYALEHIDECCLIFDITVDLPESHDNKYYSLCYICKGPHDPSRVKRKIDPDKEFNKLVFKKMYDPIFVEADLSEAMQLLEELPYDFNKSFKILYDRNKVPFNTFSQECGLDIHTVKSYYNGTNRPKNKKNAVALMSAFDVHPRITHYLLEMLTYNLQITRNEDDLIYSQLLASHRGQGYKKWNQLLVDTGKIKYRDYLIPDSAKLSDYL